MNETLWITIPTDDETALKNVINLIASKNLTNLSINQLIEKLENNEAADWIEVLTQYNEIPSLKRNTNPSQMLGRSNSVKNKFDRKNSQDQIIYPQLRNKLFQPNQLLSLVILCYSNPNLIGPKLCKALNDDNYTDIKKEMLENSAYRRSENRVLPSQSNLRLLSTALYLNDTSIVLPDDVINRVTRETIRDGRMVIKWDQRGGFEELIDGPARASSENIVNRTKRDQSEIDIDSRAVLYSLQSNEHSITAEKSDDSAQFAIPPFPTQMSRLENGSIVTPPEALNLHTINNATSSNYANGLVVGSLALFHIAKNTPVTAVIRNIGKDLAAVSKHVGSFFSKNTECVEQEQKTVLFSPTAKF